MINDLFIDLEESQGVEQRTDKGDSGKVQIHVDCKLIGFLSDKIVGNTAHDYRTEQNNQKKLLKSLIENLGNLTWKEA